MSNMTKPLDLNAIITSLRTTPSVLHALEIGFRSRLQHGTRASEVVPKGSRWPPHRGRQARFCGSHLPDEYPACTMDCDKRLDDLLNTVRAESIAFVSEPKDTELHRGGIHPRIGHIRISNLLHEWIYYDLNHLRQIGTSVQSFL
jgi:hypothetical protein